MRSLIALLLSFLTQFIHAQLYNLSSWTLSDETFSTDDQSSIMVFDDITRNIWILGGYWNGDKIYIFNIDTGSFTDVTSIYNPTQIAFRYNYFQNNNAVIINRTIYYSAVARMSSFNIDTLQYVDDLFPLYIDDHMCVVTNTDKSKLYITSGWFYSRFRIYDLLTQQVTTGPDFTDIHRGGGCHVFNNILYLFSGNFSTKIEYIDLNTLAEWNTAHMQLPTALYALSSALCDHVVFMLGGKNGGTVTNAVYIFDTKTNELYQGHSLPMYPRFSPAVCVESRLYLFRGNIDGALANTIWFADVYMLSDAINTTIAVTNTRNIDVLTTFDGTNANVSQSDNITISVYVNTTREMSITGAATVAATNTTNTNILTTFDDTNANVSQSDDMATSIYVFPSETLATNSCIGFGCDDDGDIDMNETQNKSKGVYYVIAAFVVAVFSVGLSIGCYYLYMCFVKKKESADQQDMILFCKEKRMMQQQMHKYVDNVHQGQDVDGGEERNNDDVTNGIEEEEKHKGNSLSDDVEGLVEGEIHIQIDNKRENSNDSDSEGLYNYKGAALDVGRTGTTPMIVGRTPMDTGTTPMNVGMTSIDVGTCVDCAEVKEGNIYDGDEQFYCNECMSAYVEEDER